jgi:hypothetical protein
MTSLIPVTKDLDNQQPVPTVWRDTLARVGERIAMGAYRFADIEGVVPITERLAESFAYNIEAYGEPLADLKDATWSTSVCMWQDGYWGCCSTCLRKAVVAISSWTCGWMKI